MYGMGKVIQTNYTQITRFLIVLGLVFGLMSCGGAQFDSDAASSSSSGSTTSNVLAGSINTLNTTNASDVSITFDSLTDDEEVLMMLYSYDEETTSTGFQLGTSDSSLSSSYLMNDFEATDTADDFNEALRQLERDIDDNALAATRSANMQYAVKYAAVGSQKNFKVITSTSSTSNYNTVTATLRHSTSDYEFYVDNRNASAISDADLEDLANGFSADDVRTLFGNESDVDANGKFAVLFTQEVNELGASSGGLITGFFYAVDLFDSSSYSASNEMEVYYTLVPDPNGDLGTAVSEDFCFSNVYPSVLPHEFQHMISFNQHFFMNGGSSEESWLNEALSHLAEDIINIDANDYMAETSLENPSRVSSYLNNIDSLCFSCGSNLYQRGGSYLFVRYLYEQAELGNIAAVTNGAALIELLLNTDETGVDNIKTALFGEDATEAEFKDIVGKFSLAVYFSNTGNQTDDIYNFQGINLRALQNDGRGTVLNGPSIQTVTSLPFTDTLSGVGITYLSITGAEINDNGGSFSLSLGDDAKFGGYVIRE